MNSHIIKLTLLTFFLFFIIRSSSLKIERFGTLYYKNVQDTLTQRQRNLQNEGYFCAYLEFETPLAFFENSVPDPMNIDFNRGFILTPVKTADHSETSPLVSFASFYDTHKVEICTVDRANQNATSLNKDNIGVNYLVIAEEMLGSVTDSVWTEKTNINIPLNLDIRSHAAYAYLNGVCQHKMNSLESEIIGHYDVAWIQSIDIYSKLANYAWTDASPHRSEHHSINQVYVTGLAFPVETLAKNGMEAQKDYDGGIIHFSWPEDETAIGYCHHVVYQASFPYAPTVFAALLNNMNTESISTSVWVERVTEKGCILCVSIVGTTTNTARLIRETKEQNGLYLYWVAINKVYTEEELMNQQVPLSVVVAINNLTPPIDINSQQALLKDILSLSKESIPDEIVNVYLTNVVVGEQEIDLYFNSVSEDYIIAIEKELNLKHLNETLDASFISSHKASPESIIYVKYGKSSILSNHKVESGASCSVSSCSEGKIGGTINSVKSVLVEGKSSTGTGVINSPITFINTCNASPCSIAHDSKFHLYNIDSSYVLEKQTQNNTGLIIGIVIAIILIIALVICIYINRMKARTVFRKAQSKFHQFS